MPVAFCNGVCNSELGPAGRPEFLLCEKVTFSETLLSLTLTSRREVGRVATTAADDVLVGHVEVAEVPVKVGDLIVITARTGLSANRSLHALAGRAFPKAGRFGGPV